MYYMSHLLAFSDYFTNLILRYIHLILFELYLHFTFLIARKYQCRHLVCMFFCLFLRLIPNRKPTTSAFIISSTRYKELWELRFSSMGTLIIFVILFHTNQRNLRSNLKYKDWLDVHTFHDTSVLSLCYSTKLYQECYHKSTVNFSK